MVDSDELLIVIPARGGSKRLPRKNILPLAGKPLISWTIEVALNADLGGQVMVTSDDEDILAVAQQYEEHGATIHKRPTELATDEASTTKVVCDAISAANDSGSEPKTIILLQPTSPLRSADDLHRAYQLFQENGSCNSVVSVCEVDHPTAWTGTLGHDGTFLGVDLTGRRSQDYRKEYRLNGAIYICRARLLMQLDTLFTPRTLASIMPRVRSFDIDEQLDLTICESLKGSV